VWSFPTQHGPSHFCCKSFVKRSAGTRGPPRAGGVFFSQTGYVLAGSQRSERKRLSAEPRLLPAESGADAATADLYERYGAQLYRYCYAHLRSREDAEDAVQNTFLRVYAALRKGVVPEFETAWLYKIAHNVCLSRHLGDARRAKIESPHDLQLLEDRVAAPQAESDDLVGLDDALASMPPNLRRAILLREWQGLSYAEIAQTLGLSHSAVETLIFRARRHLAQALERNVKQPARKIASALNLGPFAGAIRDLLARGGAAQLTAGAVVAVGVAGGGFAISYTLGAPKAATSAAGASSAAAAGVDASPQAPSGTGGSSPVGSGGGGGFVALPGTPLLLPTQPAAGSSTPTGSAPAAPGSAGSAPASPQDPPAGTANAGPTAAPQSPPTTVPGVVPNPALPTAEAPPPQQTSAAAATTGSVPTLPTATVTAPTVTSPTLTTPTLPTVTTLTVDQVTVPTVTVPALTTPTVTTPTVTTLTTPTLTTPTLTTPTFTTPTLSTSTVTTATVTTSTVIATTVTTPTLPLP
jgi:RNA polymerase sigma factor (sigma-70 family)